MTKQNVNAKATPKPKTATPSTYIDDPINPQKEIRGNSRRYGDAPPEIQQKCIDIIIEEGRGMGLPVRDIAYYIAIAKHESGFNPDAANSKSTATGIAQVLSDTGELYGVNKSNHFDARASIVAGLKYFQDTKNRIVKNYGQASGQYELLIYVSYHYGQFMYFRDRVNARNPIPIAELTNTENNRARFKEAEQVLADGVAFEQILKGKHALQIQLRDVLGKPLTNRKVLIVVPKTAPPAATIAPIKSEPVASSNAPQSQPLPGNGKPVPVSGEKTAIPTPAAQNVEITESATPIPEQSDLNPGMSFDVKTYTTDSEGFIPALESRGEQPFVVLVPRENFEAYNEAVMSGAIPEDEVVHIIQPRSDSPLEQTTGLPLAKEESTTVAETLHPTPTTTVSASPGINSPDKPIATAAIVKPAGATANTKPAPTKGDTRLDAAGQKQGERQAPIKISVTDVLMACSLNGLACVASGFVYMKQFSTKPKMPEKPFADEKTKAGPPPVQALSSSIKVQDSKERIAKADVVTKEQTAIKEVRANETVPWMNIALAEQNNGVQAKPGDHLENPAWQKLNNERLALIQRGKVNEKKISAERAKSPSKRDEKLINMLTQETEDTKGKVKQIEEREAEIEQTTTNPTVVKYLRSAGLSYRSGKTYDASTDNTAWCASFVNWVILQEGYKGPSAPAQAKSWNSWGDELKEPRYGAIVTLSQRGKSDGTIVSPSGSHVAFFVGQREVATRTKDALGRITETKVIYWKLLGGNQGGKEHRLQESEFRSDKYALVGIRWPLKGASQ